MTAMTTVSSLPGLRGRARVIRELRRDGIRLSVRRYPIGVETGDFVMAERLGPRRWLFAIGDAMGRGPHAEALAGAVRHELRTHAGRSARLADLLDRANAAVHEAAAGESFVSLLLLEVDANRHTVRIANAGHAEPLAAGRSGGVVALEGHGPALGLLTDVNYRDAGPLRLPMGVTMLLTTDGVTEAHGESGEWFGREGAATALAAARELGPRGVVRRVLDAVREHTGDQPVDVATAVAFRFER